MFAPTGPASPVARSTYQTTGRTTRSSASGTSIAGVCSPRAPSTQRIVPCRSGPFRSSRPSTASSRARPVATIRPIASLAIPATSPFGAAAAATSREIATSSASAPSMAPLATSASVVARGERPGTSTTNASIVSDRCDAASAGRANTYATCDSSPARAPAAATVAERR